MSRRVFGESHKPSPDEPTECLRCGLTPERAFFAKLPPAVITHPGWIQCSCSGPEPYSVTEELLKQQEAADGLDELTREIRECFREQTKRRKKDGGGSGGKGRDKPPPRDVRPEQEWHGFPEADKVTVEAAEKFVVRLKGKIPTPLRRRLTQDARRLGRHREAHLFRWLLSQHLHALEDAREVEYGSDTTMLEVLVTRRWADEWAARKDILAEATGRHVSNADMMAAILEREWI